MVQRSIVRFGIFNRIIIQDKCLAGDMYAILCSNNKIEPACGTLNVKSWYSTTEAESSTAVLQPPLTANTGALLVPPHRDGRNNRPPAYSSLRVSESTPDVMNPSLQSTVCVNSRSYLGNARAVSDINSCSIVTNCFSTLLVHTIFVFCCHSLTIDQITK